MTLSRPHPGFRPTRLVGQAALAAAFALSCVSAQALEYVANVVASGLNNPRGLAFDSQGALWITETGLPIGSGPSTIIRGETVTYSETGSVTRVFGGQQSRIFSGLPTMFVEATGQVEGGPGGIAFSPNGALHLMIGYVGVHPDLRFTDLDPVGYQFGRLISLGGAVDVAAHEALHNPDGAGIESNPWNMAWSGNGWYVTDAAANALLHVGLDDSISTVAVFPARNLGGPFPTQSVPTGVAVGPDGAVYVSEMTGFPFPGGGSRVTRVDADGSLSVFADGFTMALDIAFDPAGNLYVLEHDANGLLAPGSTGQLWRVGTDGARQMIFSDGLVNPIALAVGPDGALYVSNFGNNGAGMGEVWRVSVVPEAGTAGMLALGLAAMGVLLRRRRR